jgi:hypothetical protein
LEQRGPFEGIFLLDERDPFEGFEDPFTGIKFDVHVSCFLPEQEHPPAPTVNLEFGQVRLMVMRDENSQDYELFTDANEHDHGVTLPHLLEHLKGGNPDDLKKTKTSLYARGR